MDGMTKFKTFHPFESFSRHLEVVIMKQRHFGLSQTSLIPRALSKPSFLFLPNLLVVLSAVFLWGFARLWVGSCFSPTEVGALAIVTGVRSSANGRF